MVGWHHQLNGHEFEQTSGDSEGQGSLSCCSPWDHRVRHVQLATEQQQSNHLIHPVIQPISDHHITIYLIYTTGQF